MSVPRMAIVTGLLVAWITPQTARAQVFLAPSYQTVSAGPVAYVSSAPVGYSHVVSAPVVAAPVLVSTPVGIPTYQVVTYGAYVPTIRKYRVEYEWKKNGMWEVTYKWK